MKTEEIVKALRCVSSAGHEAGCESCSYYRAEYIPEDMRETFGSDVLYSCDIDRVGLDGADLIQHLTDRCARYAEEIAVLQERTRWIPVEERLPEVEEMVLVVVDGQPADNVTLIGALELATWYGEDWILETWPCCENMRVTHWMPLPDGPEEGR